MSDRCEDGKISNGSNVPNLLSSPPGEREGEPVEVQGGVREGDGADGLAEVEGGLQLEHPLLMQNVLKPPSQLTSRRQMSLAKVKLL
jgi:hypothetical protein